MTEVGEGTTIDGRYRLARRIGSGGMADVWLAEDAQLQRNVALKILHRRYAQDREFVERFRREAEAAAGLQHPNIVSVYDRGDVEGTYYIAMQLLEGRTLKELIDQGLTPEQAVALIRQVLEAAGFAHRHGVVHRDLKPQNVIVDDEGKATVTDFGIARAGASEITQVGSVMGTPHYLSPEGAQGQDVSAVSDLYSVGVMLYEALAGRVPFEAESSVAIAMKQVSHMPQRPSSVRPSVSPALDAVTMRALEKEPGRRFQSAEAFIAALDEALRNPGAADGGTAAFAPLPATVAEGADGERSDADEERRKRRRRWAILAAVAVLVGLLLGYALTRDTTTEVPTVTGVQLGLAVSLLEQNGFTAGEITRVQRQVAADMVLEQDPAGSPPAGEADLDCAFLGFFCSKPKVALTVSAGPGTAEVPRVNGLTEATARERLEEAGFEVEVERRNSEKVESGLVIQSQPAGAATATRGSTVTIVVSRGQRLVKVPVLVGSQRSVAVERIRARGLSPDVEEEESSTPAGEVIRQAPSAGSELPRGSTVTIVVSSGEEQAQVPNVIGRERSEAVSELRAAGLVPEVQEQATEVTSQVGRVTDQFPPPGSEVEPGTTVNVVVGRASSGGGEATAP